MKLDVINAVLSANYTNLVNMFFTLALNLVVLIVIVNFIYKKHNANREFLFTFGIFNVVIFVICYLLSNATLSIGFSFGLFAIFSILRYRTIAIPIKEMTYFFLAISVAIINALSSSVIGTAELIVANATVIITSYAFEKTWKKREGVKFIKYEKIELIKPENYAKLIEDLCARTGLQITRAEVGRIDFLRDVADMRVYYQSPEGNYLDTNFQCDDDD